MTIYDIDSKIQALIDAETGEIASTEEFESLIMERGQKIENIACLIKNLKNDVEGIKSEIQNLQHRKQVCEKQIENLQTMLKYALNGERFESARCKICYRTSESVKLQEGFLEWAKDNAQNLLRYKEPEASLSAIKDAIKSGETIPYAEIESKKNMQIK